MEVLVTEEMRANAEAIAEHVAPDERPDLHIVVSNDRPGEALELPADVAKVLWGVVTAMASCEVVRIASIPEVLTTTVAARMLGVSRPTLMKLIAQGELPSTRVGTHTRVRSADVVRLQQARERERKAAFLEMQRISNELEIDN